MQKGAPFWKTAIFGGDDPLKPDTDLIIGRKRVKMLKFLFLIGIQAFVLRDRYMANYLIGKKLGIDSSSRAMMAMMMRDKQSSPMNLLPFLYKDDNDHNISLEALYLFNYIYQHG